MTGPRGLCQSTCLVHLQPASSSDSAVRFAVDVRRLPWMRRLAVDYAFDFARLEPFFAGDPADEAAWRDTVLENGSKQEVVERTGVSDGMVARMRRMVKEYKRGTPK